MSILKQILNIGVDFKPDSDVKRIRILNGIAFFAGIVLVFNGAMIFIGSYPFERFTLGELIEYLMSSAENKVSNVQKFRILFPLLDFGLALIAFTSLLLNYYHKYNISFLLILLITNFYIAFFYWLSGFFSVFFFFIPALLPLIFYHKKRQYLPLLLFTLSIFVVLTIIKYNQGMDDLYTQPPGDKALFNSFLNFTAVLAILYFVVFHFKKENVKNEEILNETNALLNEQSQKISIQRDELHQKNNELSASEKELKELNDTKDKFLSILAHDIKNSFNSLLGFSNLLLKNFKKYDEREIENQLKAINEASMSTYNLLEQILLWTRSQTGALAVAPEKFSFLDISNVLIGEFKNQAKQKNLKIKAYTTETIMLNADLNIFKTVLRNLISNAIKFCNKNGEINVFAEKNDQLVTITVSDNGIGIDYDLIPMLWEIEKSYTTLGTENEKGTGFGLTLCKELINKHNGDIWVESKVGEGSIFKFTLPC